MELISTARCQRSNGKYPSSVGALKQIIIIMSNVPSFQRYGAWYSLHPAQPLWPLSLAGSDRPSPPAAQDVHHHPQALPAGGVAPVRRRAPGHALLPGGQLRHGYRRPGEAIGHPGGGAGHPVHLPGRGQRLLGAVCGGREEGPRRPPAAHHHGEKGEGVGRGGQGRFQWANGAMPPKRSESLFCTPKRLNKYKKNNIK